MALMFDVDRWLAEVIQTHLFNQKKKGKQLQ